MLIGSSCAQPGEVKAPSSPNQERAQLQVDHGQRGPQAGTATVAVLPVSDEPDASSVPLAPPLIGETVAFTLKDGTAVVDLRCAAMATLLSPASDGLTKLLFIDVRETRWRYFWRQGSVVIQKPTGVDRAGLADVLAAEWKAQSRHQDPADPQRDS